MKDPVEPIINLLENASERPRRVKTICSKMLVKDPEETNKLCEKKMKCPKEMKVNFVKKPCEGPR